MPVLQRILFRLLRSKALLPLQGGKGFGMRGEVKCSAAVDASTHAQRPPHPTLSPPRGERAKWAAPFLVLLLAGCGTSPEPGLYTLAPVPGSVSTDMRESVRVNRPALAGFLDRPDFVSQSGAYQLRVNETVNWAEPLDRMFARVLAADLQQRLPDAVIATDETDSAAPPRMIIETNIQQFNKIEGGQAVLRGTLLLTDRAAHVQPPPQTIALAADTGFGGSAAVAAALSELIGQYADRLAVILRAQAAQDAVPAQQPPL